MTLHVGSLGLPLDAQLLVGVGHYGAVAGVQVKVVASVVGHLAAVAAVGVLDVVYLAVELVPHPAHLVPLGQVGGAVSAGEALGVEQLVPDLPGLVSLSEHLLTHGAPGRGKQAIEVLLAVKLAKLGEAGVGEGGATRGALEAVLVEAAVTHTEHKLVLDW